MCLPLFIGNTIVYYRILVMHKDTPGLADSSYWISGLWHFEIWKIKWKVWKFWNALRIFPCGNEGTSKRRWWKNTAGR